MYESLITQEQVYGVWLAIVVFLGGFVFLRLAAKEWAYREAWLRHDARRRARRAVLQDRIVRKAQVAREIEQAGQFGGSMDQPTPSVATAEPGEIEGSSAAA
ncbi:MAG: hypothetical protein JSU68_06555 [Phycisphaerales bacterium]|nr:MAG: hypothetical protein JSU68_06555 [Phycisphaerales bacterium]